MVQNRTPVIRVFPARANNSSFANRETGRGSHFAQKERGGGLHVVVGVPQRGLDPLSREAHVHEQSDIFLGGC